MRLVQFVHKDTPTYLQFGAELDDGGNVVDLSHIAPTTLNFIRGGDYAMDVAKDYLKSSPQSFYGADVELDAPITGMDKVVVPMQSLTLSFFNCQGYLYRDEL